MISQADLKAATGIGWEQEIDRPHITEPAESPGLHPRHYAPRTPFYLSEPGTTLRSGRGCIIELPANREEFARRLYAELHKADAQGWDWIAVRKPPDTPEWAGIIDRLKRASAE